MSVCGPLKENNMYRQVLPIIDFSPFRSNSPARAEFIKEIGEAGAETGFFYLKNFGINPGRISQAFAQSRAFFALPSARKSELLWDNSTNRGYDGLEAQSFKAGQPGDLKESFRFTAEPDVDNPVDPEAPWRFLVNQPNKWPSTCLSSATCCSRFCMTAEIWLKTFCRL